MFIGEVFSKPGGMLLIDACVVKADKFINIF